MDPLLAAPEIANVSVAVAVMAAVLVAILLVREALR